MFARFPTPKPANHNCAAATLEKTCIPVDAPEKSSSADDTPTLPPAPVAEPEKRSAPADAPIGALYPVADEENESSPSNIAGDVKNPEESATGWNDVLVWPNIWMAPWDDATRDSADENAPTLDMVPVADAVNVSCAVEVPFWSTSPVEEPIKVSSKYSDLPYGTSTPTPEAARVRVVDIPALTTPITPDALAPNDSEVLAYPDTNDEKSTALPAGGT